MKSDCNSEFESKKHTKMPNLDIKFRFFSLDFYPIPPYWVLAPLPLPMPHSLISIGIATLQHPVNVLSPPPSAPSNATTAVVKLWSLSEYNVSGKAVSHMYKWYA